MNNWSRLRSAKIPRFRCWKIIKRVLHLAHFHVQWFLQRNFAMPKTFRCQTFAVYNGAVMLDIAWQLRKQISRASLFTKALQWRVFIHSTFRCLVIKRIKKTSLPFCCKLQCKLQPVTKIDNATAFSSQDSISDFGVVTRFEWRHVFTLFILKWQCLEVAQVLWSITQGLSHKAIPNSNRVILPDSVLSKGILLWKSSLKS